MNSSEVLAIAKELISKPSVTPHDFGCQVFIAEYLEKLGFTIEHLPSSDVSNLWAVYNQTAEKKPLIVFAGHTDVVPPGPLEQWDNPPFEPAIKHNTLYGRGAADMKGSVAAMLVAAKKFIVDHQNNCNLALGLLITSDEEGSAIHGTRHVVKVLQERNINIDYCIIGEASSDQVLGDTLKNGRRGSLTGELIIYGTQGHVAYPTRANNAIHTSLNFLTELTTTQWDNGNEYFPPTSLQIVNIEAGTGATNVIPGTLSVNFNLRYASCSSFDSLTATIEKLLNKHQLNYKINWQYYAEPFLTKKGTLTTIVQNAVQKITNNSCALATNGGTSDGRFISPAFDCQLIELGPINHCIHKVNEHISIDDLEKLVDIYAEILNQLNHIK